MANVTPQFLSSFEFYEPLTEKKSLSLPLQCSHLWGGKCHPLHKQPRATPLPHSTLHRDCFQQGQPMAVRRKNLISHWVISQCTWTRRFSSREKHCWSFRPQLVWPLDFSLA